MKYFAVLILLAFIFGGVAAGVVKRSIPDVEVPCVDGLSQLLEELYDLVYNNDVTNMCKSPSEEDNKVCEVISGPLSAVVGKIDEVVNVLVAHFAADVVKRSIPHVEVPCINGLSKVLEELYDVVSNNDVTNKCNSSSEDDRKVCNVISGPLTAVIGKIDEVVNVLVAHCKN
ncbi:hypothetical protein FF38_08189 [Lucilia cuprina]|uniref:Protein TsetseEP domain-containing protein n=1 Tax=Lucilia cuprina TaxID=7375 RepID=A0A0L0C0K8_LUCCU|nr:hypothetical protein FF38_08189 [Lucilia cuprina]